MPRSGSILFWLWITFFFQGMASGFWYPSLTNILKSKGLGDWVATAFVVPPICALVSPLIGGALADQRMTANRLFIGSSLIGGISLWAAFATLDAGWSPWWFIALLGGFSLTSGPLWGLLTTVSMTHLVHGERQYPLARLGATVGWMAAGWIASYAMGADARASCGYLGAAAKGGAALCALALPLTPPLGKGTSWRSLLGFDAFQLLRDRDHRVFFGVTLLFSVPITAFYMYAPEHLAILGNDHPTGTMTVAQATELVAMFAVGWIMTRVRLKWILLCALGLSALRLGLSSFAGYNGHEGWHIVGIALHGICYTLYFITGQVYLDRSADPGLKSQAQGLLALVSSGLGPFAGALVCGGLRSFFVTDGGTGWAEFWGVLAGMVVVCVAIFAIFYQGPSRPRATASGADASV